MYKVLIVDDNNLIRKSIIARVNWEEMHMKVLGEARNGEDAFDKICTLKPDIVVTDIKMPKADGFYLIEKTKEILPNIQYIVISGYDDFKYTKKAILYKVVNYILKPINNDELIGALITAKKNIVNHMNQLEKKSNQNISKYFISYFNDNITHENFIDLLNKNDFNFQHRNFLILSINLIDQADNTALFLSEDLITNMHKLLCSFFTDSNINLVTVNRSLLCVLINTNNNYFSNSFWGNVYESTSNFLCSLRDSRKIVLGYSQSYDNIVMLRDAYWESINALYCRFTESKGKNIYQFTNKDLIDKIDQSILEQIKISLMMGLSNETCRNISLLFEKSLNIGIDPIQLWYIINSLVNIFKTLIMNNELDKNLINENLFTRYFFLSFENLSQIIEHFMEISTSICKQIKLKTSDNLGKTIVEYVNTNYTKSINLNTLANTFHLNNIYLGQLLKNEVGMSFNKYMNKLRVEHAKKIIKNNSTIKLVDLANSIGYSDSHYFSKIFKQVTGMTPTEYRKMI